MTEVWKPIVGYEDYYAVSNLGNVKNIRTNTILTGDINNIGYRRVCLYIPIRKRYFIHRLVAMHFVEGFQEDLVVNHKDGNKLNNCSDNLEWVTHSENDIHAYENNLRHANNKRKIIKYDLQTNKIIDEYNSIKEASIENNTTTCGISKVCNGHFSQWLGYGYKFT